MSEIKAGAIINYVNTALRMGIGFFMSPFIIAHLGKSEFGLYSIAGTIVSYLALMDFGLSPSVGRFLSEYQAKKDAEGEAHFLGNITALFSLIGSAILVAGVVIFFFLHLIFPNFTPEELQTYRVLYLIALLNTALCYPLHSLSGVLLSRQKFIVPGLLASVMSLINVGGVVLILTMGYKSIGLLAFNALTGVAGLIFNSVYAFAILKVRMSWNGWDKALCRRVFNFSCWVFIIEIAVLISWGSGSFVVGITQTAAAVAVFAIGQALFSYYYSFSSLLSRIFLPRVVKLVAGNASREELTMLMVQVGRVLFVLLMLMLSGMYLFGLDFLQLWVGHTLGEQVWESWLVALILCTSLTIPMTQSLGTQILQAKDLVRYNAKIQGLTSLLGLVCAVVFSYLWGVYGVAIGSALSFILGRTLYMSWLYHTKAGVDIWMFFRETYRRGLLALALPVACGVAMLHYFPIDGWVALIVEIGLYSLIFVGSMLLIYATAEERKMLKIG